MVSYETNYFHFFPSNKLSFCQLKEKGEVALNIYCVNA
ncbi:hypothetical protein C943_02692 [Mariniradius saccharolyticus AK6]|uniref:Uncharacterized protein n=1 Tax=Mariniradius saccharolyticus AK6 TaxID=1239962 RepID=M7XR10_9BACT|nr:hypothetical protein C943_02692 [Mariniradius saccharolyticus AK6]